ncbi:MAG: hypothetical protein GX639_21185 [Fibrobacter sp.]|nr:hypothetical protein [Fibrobacter sp.]
MMNCIKYQEIRSTQKLTMFFFFALFVSCGSDVAKQWNFEWSYCNRVDSSAILLPLEPIIDIKSTQFDPSAENPVFNQNGKLTFSVYIVGSDSYVYDFHNNAKLHVQLFLNNNVCFDTLFTWNELRFSKADDVAGNKNQDVNFQTFYISAFK